MLHRLIHPTVAFSRATSPNPQFMIPVIDQRCLPVSAFGPDSRRHRASLAFASPSCWKCLSSVQNVGIMEHFVRAWSYQTLVEGNSASAGVRTASVPHLLHLRKLELPQFRKISVHLDDLIVHKPLRRRFRDVASSVIAPP